MKTFLSQDKKAGYAVHDDDIVSLFRHPEAQKGVAGRALEHALKNGGRRLDCFDTVLPHLYSEKGFRAVARLPFDPKYQPENWDEKAYSKWNGGRPDVVFMVHDPSAPPYSPGDGKVVSDYDEGAALQRAHLEGSVGKALKIARKHRDAGGGVHPMEIGTRLITSKKAQPQEGLTNVSMDAMRDSPPAKAGGPGLLQKGADLIRNYPGMEHLRDLPHEQLAEAFISHVKNNLLWLHDRMPADLRERSSHWYEGANKIANQWAKQYNIPVQSAAAALAALSPQKDWFQNVSLAHRVLHTLKGQGDNFTNGFTFSPEMEKKLGEITALNKPEYAPLHQHVFGKSYSDLDHLVDKDGKPLEADEKAMAKAMWLRLHAEAHNSRAYNIVSPEGEIGDVARNAPKALTQKQIRNGEQQGLGEPAKVGWGSLNEIAKAIQAIESGGDHAKINELMGEQHKVRNFYNNILSPNSPHGHTTIDTHAVAAGLLRPLSGNDLEVAHNFGNYPGKEVAARLKRTIGRVPTAGGSAITGIKGLYPLYHEAYKRAAQDRGLLPRQMQSITWEAVRGLFPDTYKNESNNRHIDQLWTDYGNGRRSLNDTREAILQHAGGIRPPEWAGGAGQGAPAGAPDAQAGHPGNPGIVRGTDVNGRQAPPAGVFRRGGSVDSGASSESLRAALRVARAHGGGLHKPKHVRLHVGPIHSHVAGRTDHLPNHVPSGSYVLPADIVSGMGEGNTISGFRQVRRMFGGAPYGSSGEPYGQSGGPYLVGKADGGSLSGGEPVPVVLAGGEHVLTPEEVLHAGMGDMDAGHKALDGFVKAYREKTIKTLKGLPGPRHD